MIMSVTGHRPHKLGHEYHYKGIYSTSIINQSTTVLEHYKPSLVFVGFAIGFDTIIAILCFKMGIPYVACLPFKGQEKNWPEISRTLYHTLLKKANKIYICDIDKYVTYKEYLDLPNGPYSPAKMQTRNEFMVDQLREEDDFLLACFNGTAGGTANCIKYAQSKNKKIVFIKPLT